MSGMLLYLTALSDKKDDISETRLTKMQVSQIMVLMIKSYLGLLILMISNYTLHF